MPSVASAEMVSSSVESPEGVFVKGSVRGGTMEEDGMLECGGAAYSGWGHVLDAEGAPFVSRHISMVFCMQVLASANLVFEVFCGGSSIDVSSN